MKIQRIPTPAEFDATLAEIMENIPNKKYVVLFFGTEQSDTMQSWCPDCVIADPIIRSAIMKSSNNKDIVLIECPVGDRSVYSGNKNHPYRLHKDVMLKFIPTLISWTKVWLLY